MKNINYVLKLLGNKYSILKIDRENVVYRNFKNGIEIEISGLDNYKKKKLKMYIFVWKNKEIIFRTAVINQIDQLILEVSKIAIGCELEVLNECTSKI